MVTVMAGLVEVMVVISAMIFSVFVVLNVFLKVQGGGQKVK